MADVERKRPNVRTTYRLTQWLLLDGNRIAVTGLFAGIIFVTFLFFGTVGVVTVTKPNRMMWLLNGIVNGLLTLIPISVGINQIVLSQELGSVDDLYSRLESTLNFRQRVERTTSVDVSSPQSAGFFHDLFSALNDRANALGRASTGGLDEQLSDELTEYAETLANQTNQMMSDLEDVGYSFTSVLLSLFSYYDSGQFYEARRLRNANSDALPEETDERLEEVITLFVELDAAQQYFKTLFVQRELSELSRVLIYTGIPAILVAGLTIFSYRNIPGVTLPRPVIVVIVSTTVTVTLLPLAVLSAYIVRVALVAQRTAAFGPFISPEEYEGIQQQD